MPNDESDEKAPGGETDDRHSIVIRRFLHHEYDIDTMCPRTEAPRISIKHKISKQCVCSKRRAWKILSTLAPVIPILKSYRIRKDLMGDVLSGLSAGFMHLPQGMGFGILAGLTPAVGLYSTFFPIVFYLIFGASPHVSFGTNAVIAMLTAEIIDRQSVYFIPGNSTLLSNGTDAMIDDELMTYKIAIAASVGFISGLMLIVMAIFQLGSITAYFSAPFIGGFTTAAAVHITTSQVSKMFGIKMSLYTGAGKIIKTYVHIFRQITETRPAEVIISVVCIVTLLIIKIGINEEYKEQLKIPIPIDLVVVILGTVVSHFGHFNADYNVTIVGPMRLGIPAPQYPSLNNVSNIVLDCFVMAILIFVLTISMAKICSRQHGYEINDNQELFSYGVTNFLSSFFHCFPSCVAPPRTMILSSMGARTTLNGIFSAIFILLVLLVAGRLFSSLPVSVLAAMIAVAMRGLLKQVLDLKRYWRVNKYDFLVWIITFISSVFIDLDIGIGIGVGASILFLVIQSQRAHGYRLGKADNEDAYMSVTGRDNVSELNGIKIFRFESALHFANSEQFRKRLYEETLNPKLILKYKLKNSRQKTVTSNKRRTLRNENVNVDTPMTIIHENIEEELRDTANLRLPEDDNKKQTTKVIILDCLPITYIDMVGLNTLDQIVREFTTIDIVVLFARFTRPVLETIGRAGLFNNISKEHVLFDLCDAIEKAKMISESDGEEVANKTPES